MNRKEQILDAALILILENGYSATTMEMVRRNSGASTGSIYHFFSGKADIGQTLLHEAIQGWQEETQAITGADPTAERLIKGAVLGLLRWGARNPRLFAFLDEVQSRRGFGTDFAVIDEELRKRNEEGAIQYAGWTQQGIVKPISWALAHALAIGPAYDYLRRHALEAVLHEDDFKSLADAAWDSLRL